MGRRYDLRLVFSGRACRNLEFQSGKYLITPSNCGVPGLDGVRRDPASGNNPWVAAALSNRRRGVRLRIGR